MSGRSVGKIITILSFWVSTSKNEIIDHQVKACVRYFLSNFYFFHQMIAL